MTDFIAYLFSMFVIVPLQAEIADSLKGLPSADMVAAARNCLAVAGPQLLERAQNEWGWVAANLVGVNIGLVEPAQLLSGLNGDCDRVVGLLGEEQ